MSYEDFRLICGQWLFRYRAWGLIPLFALGLADSVKAWPVGSGKFMLLAGAIGILFGTLLRIVTSTFVSHRESHDPNSARRLVTDGPFAISRNPGYMGESAIALGIAMMSRMPWLVLITIVTGLIVMSLVIEWEEHALRMRFGHLYDEYCRMVPRWFSWSHLFRPESYFKTRGRVKLLAAVRAESGTMLIGLLAILAFLAKADVEIISSHIFP